MTTAVVITLLASFIWAATSHIDKYLLCKIDPATSSIKTLMVISSLVAGGVLAPIWLIINKFQIRINISALSSIIIAVVLYLIATFLYLKALEKNDATNIIVMYQLIPVFSYILAWLIFNETLSLRQIIGGLIIISAAIIISLDFNSNVKNGKFVALIMMAASSFLCSLYYIFFEFAMQKAEYNIVSFWYQAVLFIIGSILILIKSYRQEFLEMIRRNGKKYLALNVVNESLNLCGVLMTNFANLLIPLALVNILNGFQGGFVFIIGAIGTIFLPKVFSEDLSKKVVFQKVGCIILGIVGMTVMFL